MCAAVVAGAPALRNAHCEAMIYLCSGAREELARVLVEMNVGLMETPVSHRPRQRARFRWWAADNGCYSQGESFDLEKYLCWLGNQSRADCLFATAPDIVGDALATWKRSAPVLPTIRDLGYPAALVAQDGVEDTAVDWDAFDVVFIGGTTEWKLGEAAQRVGKKAKGRGKWVHMGRVNTRARIRYAVSIGCDSVDGTLLKFGPDRNFIELCRFMSEVASSPQLPLFLEEVVT